MFLLIIVGLLLYSGVTIFYYLTKALFSNNSNQKKAQHKSQDILRSPSTSTRNQQRDIRRTSTNQRTTSKNISTSQKKKSQPQTWRELASEFKDALNELDTAGSKQASTQKRNTVNKTNPKRNVSASKWQDKYSREGSGSSEGMNSSEGRRSSEGSRGLEGSASYEGTEFHPKGHATVKQPVSRDAYSPSLKIGKTDLQKNIVNAVVYKEILDKPRSKRPFR